MRKYFHKNTSQFVGVVQKSTGFHAVSMRNVQPVCLYGIVQHFHLDYLFQLHRRGFLCVTGVGDCNGVPFLQGREGNLGVVPCDRRILGQGKRKAAPSVDVVDFQSVSTNLSAADLRNCCINGGACTSMTCCCCFRVWAFPRKNPPVPPPSSNTKAAASAPHFPLFSALIPHAPASRQSLRHSRRPR